MAKQSSVFATVMLIYPTPRENESVSGDCLGIFSFMGKPIITFLIQPWYALSSVHGQIIGQTSYIMMFIAAILLQLSVYCNNGQLRKEVS